MPIIRCFICFFFLFFFHNYYSYIKFRSWDWKPVTHKLRASKFLLDCTLNYYNFLSLCDLQIRWRRANRISVSLFFLIPRGQYSVSVQTRAAWSSAEMYGWSASTNNPTEFSVCCLLELFDTDVKSVNHTRACAHIVTVYFSSVAVRCRIAVLLEFWKATQ